jgi:hypothetical protein
VLNVLLFVPLGLALHRNGASPLRAFTIGLALAIAIELIQLGLPGRSTTLRDALMNASGAGVGALIAGRFSTWLEPSPLGRLRAWGAAAFAVGVVLVTGMLATYAAPDSDYYVHWSARQKHLAPWSGSVHRATVGGISAPRGRHARPEAIRAALLRGDTIRVVGIAGRPTPRLGGILSVSDARKREVLIIGPDGHDLVVRVRRRAATFRLADQSARFHDLLATISPGSPLLLSVYGPPERICVSVNADQRCARAPSFGSAWMLLRHYEAWPVVALRSLDALTLLLLTLPVGLFLTAVGATEARVLLSVLAVGLCAASLVTPLAFPSVAEVLAAALGVLLGIALGRRVRARTHSRALAARAIL